VAVAIASLVRSIVAAMGRSETWKPEFPLSFPFVVVDEACQSLEAATLVPVVNANPKCLVLLGDPMQLPPTVLSNDEVLEKSLMERPTSKMPAPVMVTAQKDAENTTEAFLNTVPALPKGKRGARYTKAHPGGVLLKLQYRMHPSISAFPSAVFYDGLLATPVATAEARSAGAVLISSIAADENVQSFGNVALVDVCSDDGTALEVRSEGSDGVGEGTYRNEREGEAVVALAKQIIGTGDYKPEDIGVITPYNGQKYLLTKLLGEAFEADGGEGTIEVNTVDGYQGREKRVIIFSAVRSNRGKKVGFLSDGRRLNVALTRAKDVLVVVADVKTVSGGDKKLGQFCSWVKSTAI